MTDWNVSAYKKGLLRDILAHRSKVTQEEMFRLLARLVRDGVTRIEMEKVKD